jgi:PAS domain S-box-containing protein
MKRKSETSGHDKDETARQKQETTCLPATSALCQPIEETLRKSEQRFRSLVEATSDWIWEIDRSGSYTYASPKVMDLLGYMPEEVLGKKPFDFMPPDEARRTVKLFALIVKSRKPFSAFENINLRKDGRQTVLETSGVPVFDERGKFAGYRGIDRDITERKVAEKDLIESEERYRTAIEYSNDGVALVRGGQHIYVNQKFLEIFGYDKPEDVVGKAHGMTVHPDDLEMVLDYNRRRQNGEEAPSRYEFKGLRKEGTPISVEVSGARTTFLGEPVTLAYFRDITERKLAEMELRRYKEHLEELVQERTNELMTANAQLQREITERKQAEGRVRGLNLQLQQRMLELRGINEGLRAMSYSLSHDLRTSLVTIGGFSRKLLEKYGEGLDDKGRHYLRIINRNSAQMEDLIRDLLAFFSSRSKEMKVTTIKMDGMVQEVFDQLRVIHQDRQIQLKIKTLPDTKGDRTMIRLVLANLLNNAIKYSRSRNIAVIEVAGWSDADKNTYYVKDNGIGFAMEQAQKLFEVFHRLHSSEDFEGTGLGLAIVQYTIRRHGGEVWAEAKVGEGATFYFSIPKEIPQNGAPADTKR